MISTSEIITLFNKICEEGYEIIGNNREVKITDNNKEVTYNLSNIYHKTKELIKKANKKEQTAFLTLPILEQAFSIILKLLLIPAEELLQGDTHRIEDIRNLKETLNNNEVKDLWKEKTDLFCNMAAKLGLPVNRENYEDIADISPILMDAFTILDNRTTRIEQYYMGKEADTKIPIMFAKDVSVYESRTEFLQALKQTKEQKVLAFGAIRNTFAQTNDYMADYTGFNERKQNWMRNYELSEEELMKVEDTWAREVLLGVKNGDNVYLIHDGVNADHARREKIYNFGERTSYFPYLVLFKTAPHGTETENALAVIKRTWQLSQVLDEEQKVYLPVMLSCVIDHFFKQRPPQLELSLTALPDTRSMQVPKDLLYQHPNQAAAMVYRNVYNSCPYRISSPYSRCCT